MVSVEGGLAFYVQIYEGNMKDSIRMMERLYRPESGFLYAIHVDEKLDRSKDEETIEAYRRFMRRWEYVENVMMMPRRKVTYRGVSMVLSTLEGISALLDASDGWHHVINLSGSDYPLLDPRLLEPVVRDCRGGNRSFTRFDDYNVTRKTALYMSNRYLINWEDGALAGRDAADVKAYKSEGTTRAGNEGFWYMYRQPTFPIHKGSAWMILSRDAARFVTQSPESRWMIAFFSHTVSSPELFFHTLLSQSDELWPLVENVDMHYTNWKGTSQHPRVLTQTSDWDRIRKFGKMFARKVRARESSELMDIIDEKLLWFPGDADANGTSSSITQGQAPAWFENNLNNIRGSCGLEKSIDREAFRSGKRVYKFDVGA